jgi:cation diffusion facilitator CzcD-associated flavoprotein CzcO
MDRYFIIGAGPAGLAQARAFRWAGVPFDLFERHVDVGGIWDLENPGTPMYASCRLISSRRLSGFFDFPMPRDYPDYPTRAQVLTYLREFARAYHLYEQIEFGREVARVEQTAGEWVVRLVDGECRRYAGVVCANGMNWVPNRPEYPGRFTGEVRHAVDYKNEDQLAGRRVLVVGGGNTGFEIACDAADIAAAAFLSLRRGYYIIPKHIFGVPADLFAKYTPSLPMRLKQTIFQGLLRLIIGDLRSYGLPQPDHSVLESHPVINTEALEALRAGRLQAKPDIRELADDQVVFNDGSRERVDLILYATGYQMRVPFMDEQLFDWKGDRLDAYLSVFNRSHETLFTLGFLMTNAGVYEDFDRLATMIACYARDRVEKPERAARFRDLVAADQPDLTGGLHFVESPRHATYAEHDAFRHAVERTFKTMSWPELRPGTLALPQNCDGARNLTNGGSA